MACGRARGDADVRAQLVQAKNDLGLRGIRMHGWLDDDMSVAPTARPPFFFYNLDLVADHLVSLDISPVFELSYMPRSMANCTAAQACYSAFHNRGGYKGLVEPPSDYALWYGLVRELGQHLVAPTLRWGSSFSTGCPYIVFQWPVRWALAILY